MLCLAKTKTSRSSTSQLWATAQPQRTNSTCIDSNPTSASDTHPKSETLCREKLREHAVEACQQWDTEEPAAKIKRNLHHPWLSHRIRMKTLHMEQLCAQAPRSRLWSETSMEKSLALNTNWRQATSVNLTKTSECQCSTHPRCILKPVQWLAPLLTMAQSRELQIMLRTPNVSLKWRSSSPLSQEQAPKTKSTKQQSAQAWIKSARAPTPLSAVVDQPTTYSKTWTVKSLSLAPSSTWQSR